MRIAENYHRIPKFFRKAFIEAPANLLPRSELRRSRVSRRQTILAGGRASTVERYYRWMSAFDRQAKSGIYTDDFAGQINGSDAAGVLGEWFKRANGSGIVDATMLTDQMTYLPNDLLVKVDIASMANSLEARSPFLDHKVIEFAASLPENLKLQGRETKTLLKKVAARLVPSEVIYRRKMGFGVPIGKWFREEMKDFVRDVLLSQKSLQRGIIRPEVLKRYVTEHITGERDHSFQIWTLLMLELWFQRFIDRQ